jgi:hypothetical protein
MGAGNFLPNNDLWADWSMIYVEADYEKLVDDVVSACFDSVFKHDRPITRDGLQIVAENNLFMVCVGSNQWSQVVLCGVSSRSPYPGIAARHCRRQMSRIKDALVSRYNLFIRNGPWTSTRIK